MLVLWTTTLLIGTLGHCIEVPTWGVSARRWVEGKHRRPAGVSDADLRDTFKDVTLVTQSLICNGEW